MSASEEQALLREILRHPALDAPRLALAERLERQGDARGELIRLQVGMTRTRRTHDVGVGAWGEAWNRANALIEQHGRQWTASIPAYARAPRLHRGFVEQVTIDAEDLLRHADELYAVAPIQRLTICGDVRPIFDSPALDRIISLDLRHDRLGDDGARLLAASPHVGNLVWLDLGFNDIGMGGLEAIAASDRLPRLGWLGFQENRAPEPEESCGVDFDGSGIVSTGPSPISAYLDAKYGPRAWVHAASLHTNGYPPMPDDLLGSVE